MNFYSHLRWFIFQIILGLFLFDVSINVALSAQESYMKLAQDSYRKKLYFTSATFFKLAINEGRDINYKYTKLLDDIIERTNIFPFLDVSLDLLKNINTSENVAFIIGKKYYFKKDYQNAIVYFRKITSKSTYYLSATYHLAALYQILGQEKESEYFFNKCLVDAKKEKKSLDYKSTKVVEEEVEYIYDSCENLKARHYYKFQDYKKSKSSFRNIPINSYIFPQSLFESSWAYLIERDFMRAVGKNLTFQAPVMNNYFIPETELVKLLSYIELCYWEDSLELIKSFDKNAKSKVAAFVKEFNLGSRGKYQFAQLFTDKSQRARLGDTFFNRLLDVIWVRPGFQTIKYYLMAINNEKKIIERSGSELERRAFQVSYTDFIEFFNDFVKIRLIGMAKSIIKVSNIFSEIELDVYSSMKYQLYSAKSQGKNLDFKERTPFYVRKIGRNSQQHYWNFTGEFWADELGAYIPVLESKCGGKSNSEILLGKDPKETKDPKEAKEPISNKSNDAVLPPPPAPTETTSTTTTTDQIFNSDGSPAVDSELPPAPASSNSSGDITKPGANKSKGKRP